MRLKSSNIIIRYLHLVNKGYSRNKLLLKGLTKDHILSF